MSKSPLEELDELVASGMTENNVALNDLVFDGTEFQSAVSMSNYEKENVSEFEHNKSADNEKKDDCSPCDNESVPTSQVESLQENSMHHLEQLLFTTIRNINKSNNNLVSQLSSSFATDELKTIHRCLEQQRSHLVATYEQLRLLGKVSMKTEVDRVERDIHHLLEVVASKMDEKIERKTVSSYASTKSKSSSRRSSASAKVTAIAERATLQAKLRAQEQRAKIQEDEDVKKLEWAKKNREIERQHLKDLVEIEEQKIRSLEEEESLSLLGGRLEAMSTNQTKRINIEEQRESMDNNGTADKGSMWNSELSNVMLQITENMLAARYPAPEPPVFNGEPLRFPDWKFAFNTMLRSKGVKKEDRIHHLQRYVGRAARKAVQGFFLLQSNQAFEDAWMRLEHRYGNPYKITESFRERLENWPKISSKDTHALLDFSDFLCQCAAAQQEIPALSILDDYRENKRLLTKLPDWIVRRWLRKIREKIPLYPSFQEFAQFVAAEADHATDPLTCLPYGSQNHNDEKVIRIRSQALDTEAKEASVKHRACLYCRNIGHEIADCHQFSIKLHSEKLQYVKRAGLCFRCLKRGHLSNSCLVKELCNTCQGRHATSMHASELRKESEPIDSSNAAKTVAEHEVTLEGPATNLSIMRQESTPIATSSMVVPVMVSKKCDPTEELLVYALLDTQSNCSFILESTCKELNAKATPVTLELTTMTSTGNRVDSAKVGNLQIRGLYSSELMDLPPCYTRQSIPVNRDHIPTATIAKQWPHLQKLQDQIPEDLRCDIGLLLGYNCSDALIPREVVSGKKSEPFAMRTDLGWSIIGTINQLKDGDALDVSHHMITTEDGLCQASYAQEVLPSILKVSESDFADKDPNNMSQEDIKSTKIAEQQMSQGSDSHHYMPPPFSERPKMLSNRNMSSGAYCANRADATFDPLAFIKKPLVLVQLIALLLSIVIFGCIASREIASTCLFSGDSSAGDVGIGVSNLFGAHDVHVRALDKRKDPKRKIFFRDKQCEMLTNTPKSSHMGGVWERAIRSIKSFLSGILSPLKCRLDTSTLRTVFYEAMSVVNSRPLSADRVTSSSETSVITPNHLLTMKTSVVLPLPGEFSAPEVYGRKRWHQAQQLANESWKKFKEQYLVSLQERQKWQTKREELAEGDIVVVKDEDQYRGDWPVGIIQAVKRSGTDNLVRHALIRLGNKHLDHTGKPMAAATQLERPVHKLVVVLKTYEYFQ